MSEEYKIQINTNISGDLVNIRGGSGEELAEVMDGFAANAVPIFKGLGDVKQAALAHGVFNSPAPSGGGAPTGASTPPGETPSCPTHGPMKDMRGKRTKSGAPYKNRFYCKTYGCQDSKGQGVWIE